MRIPITINGRGEPLRRAPEPLGLHARPRDEYGSPRMRARRGPEPLKRNRTNLAVDYRTDEDEYEEDNGFFPDGREAVREEPLQGREEAHARPEETDEHWKDRYIRLRADFDNYKRHAEAQKEHLAGIGKEKVLEDVFPLVEHMERAIKAAKDSADQSGILEGIKMVYQEMLKVLEKNGIERIETLGKPFDPEIHEAVAVTPHPDFPENTVVEEVRAGFTKNGKLLRPASVVVAQ